MSDCRLFCDSSGKWYEDKDVKDSLLKVQAADCDVLFIHSDISFGLPERGLSRKEYLGRLFQSIAETGVKTIIYPTFTYSFCNGENYDVRSSKTSMGALNEYARKMAGNNRSLDPLLSVVVFGEQTEKFIKPQTCHSLGVNSIFDILHQMPNVKFLFFGAEFSNCFTYVHYVEKMLDVPYRFDMPFYGNIIDGNGNSFERRQYIHTACEKIQPIDFYHFKDFLIENGCLKVEKLGDREIAAINESDAYYWIKAKLVERMDYFLARPFTEADLARKYTYNRANGRITHC